MRIRAGWGGDLARAAREAECRLSTARIAELRGSSNGLRRERHVVELDGSAYDTARRELLAFRWFPPGLLRTAVAPDGVTVMQRCRIGPISVDAPIRVVERVEEEHRVAIAVVTVDGHPERGVERYELVLDPALDRVTLAIDKAWSLADPLARLAAPFASWLQAHATGASLRRFRERRW
jgi:uncharacterized protein (UPF0548 family)